MDNLQNINREHLESIIYHHIFLQLAKKINTREMFLCYNICSYQFGLLELKDYDSLNRNFSNTRLEKRFYTLASEIDCVEQGILDFDFVVFHICRGGHWGVIVYGTKNRVYYLDL